MEASDERPANAVCPPHHWVIAGEGNLQHWSCQRCGAEREHRVPVEEERRGPWRGYSGGSKKPPPGLGQ